MFLVILFADRILGFTKLQSILFEFIIIIVITFFYYYYHPPLYHIIIHYRYGNRQENCFTFYFK